MEVTNFIPGNWREWRRRRAWELKQQGGLPRAIAEVLGVSEEAVCRWLARARRGRPDALRHRSAPGRPPKLVAEQKRRIAEFLWHGPEAYGFTGPVGTCARIASVLQEEFAVGYHQDPVSRLLQELGWTPPMPIRRVLQRDESAIERWRTEGWPERFQQACEQRRVLVFEDEPGFYLLPGRVRTYSPRGHSPVIRSKQTRDHLSLMGGRTPPGKIYTLVRQKPLKGWHCIEFLEHLRAVTGQRRLVIGDGSPLHRRAAVRQFVAPSPGEIQVEFLPGSAPDLNPWDEGGWPPLQNVQMRNRVCHDLEELHEQFHLAGDRLRHKPHLVQAFFVQAGLELPKS
jgi:transposase